MPTSRCSGRNPLPCNPTQPAPTADHTRRADMDNTLQHGMTRHSHHTQPVRSPPSPFCLRRCTSPTLGRAVAVSSLVTNGNSPPVHFPLHRPCTAHSTPAHVAAICAERASQNRNCHRHSGTHLTPTTHHHPPSRKYRKPDSAVTLPSGHTLISCRTPQACLRCHEVVWPTESKKNPRLRRMSFWPTAPQPSGLGRARSNLECEHSC